MKISKLLLLATVNKPSVSWSWMQTMTCIGCSSTKDLEVPKILITLAKNHPTSEVIEFKDSSLGIEINGQIWASEARVKFTASLNLPDLTQPGTRLKGRQTQ